MADLKDEEAKEVRHGKATLLKKHTPLASKASYSRGLKLLKSLSFKNFIFHKSCKN